MPWPLSQEYNEAIQAADLCFRDPDLRQAQARTNALGLPMPCSGNFADVYEMTSAGGKNWAVKCFTRQVQGLRERYSAISAYLKQVDLPFMVDFTYLDSGIQVNGQSYPILKMHWVEGFPLNAFIGQNADNPALLQATADLWLKLARRLREAGMAHADLQHGNVLLVPGKRDGALSVRLIDYDGMWVPALAQSRSGEVGHPAYQHPRRLREGTYNAEVDRFPHLVTYTALRALMVGGRELWTRYDNGDNLLFRQQDLAAPAQSPLVRELAQQGDEDLRRLVDQLSRAVHKPVEETPLLDELVPAPSRSVRRSSKPGARRPSRSPLWIGIALLLVLMGLVAGGVKYVVSKKRTDAGPVAIAATSAKGNTTRTPASQPEPQPDPPPVRQAELRLAPIAEVVLEPGQTTTITVRVERKDCRGPIELRLEDLPKGVQASPAFIGAEAVAGEVRLTAAADAGKANQLVRLVAVAADARTSHQFRLVVKDTRVITNSIDMKLLLLPAGKFTMGSLRDEKDRQADEEQHEVEITRPFYMGMHTVTVGQFGTFVRDSRYLTNAEKDGGGSGYNETTRNFGYRKLYNWKNVGWAQTDQHPVVNLTWNDAVAFCDWLSKKEGQQYRLPTEAKWEYACRAGTTTRFSSGDDNESLKAVANVADVSFKRKFSGATWAMPWDDRYSFTAPVGRFKPNPFGLYDMHGNVWQWCADLYDKDYYRNSRGQDPEGPDATNGYRVMRGGSFDSNVAYCRSANRSYNSPAIRRYNSGFRVVRVLTVPGLSSLTLLPLADVTLKAGEDTVLEIKVERKNCTGPIRVTLDGLPDKVTAAPATIGENESAVKVKLSSAADAAAVQRKPIRVVATADQLKAESELRLTIPQSAVVAANKMTVDLGAGVKLQLVLIPGGTFWMGGGGGKPGERQEKIGHDFYLGVTAVTQGQWQAVMGSNPSHSSRTGGGKKRVREISDADLKQFPVERVSWDDAQQFIQKLNAQHKNSGWLYRLPTEAEWEYACRGGATSKEECAFHYYFDKPTNDLSSEQANFDGNFPGGNAPKGHFLGRTCKVGSYRPNRLGLYDMHGNVCQWCVDSYNGGRYGVVRGGSWHFWGRDLRAAYRWPAPAGRNGDLGLRLARVPSGQESK